MRFSSVLILPAIPIFFFLIGEEPAAIQFSRANSFFLILEWKHKDNPVLHILSSNFYLQLSFLVFLVALSQKLCLSIQMSLPMKKSLVRTTPRITTTLKESLHLSEQKRNGNAICILLKTTISNRSLQNDTTATTFHSSCKSTNSSWPFLKAAAHQYHQHNNY